MQEPILFSCVVSSWKFSSLNPMSRCSSVQSLLLLIYMLYLLHHSVISSLILSHISQVRDINLDKYTNECIIKLSIFIFSLFFFSYFDMVFHVGQPGLKLTMQQSMILLPLYPEFRDYLCIAPDCTRSALCQLSYISSQVHECLNQLFRGLVVIIFPNPEKILASNQYFGLFFPNGSLARVVGLSHVKPTITFRSKASSVTGNILT